MVRHSQGAASMMLAVAPETAITRKSSKSADDRSDYHSLALHSLHARFLAASTLPAIMAATGFTIVTKPDSKE